MQVPKVSAKTLPGTLTSFYIRYSQMTDNVWHFSPHSIVIKSNGSATLNVNVLLSMHIIYIYIYQGWVISREFVPILLHCSTSAELTWQRGGGKGKMRNRQEIALSPPLFSPTDSPFINHSALIEKLRCCPLFVTQAGKFLTKKIKCRICNICCLNRGGAFSVSSF